MKYLPSCLLALVALLSATVMAATRKTSIHDVVLGSEHDPEIHTLGKPAIPPPFIPGEDLQLQFEWGNGFTKGDKLVISVMGSAIKPRRKQSPTSTAVEYENVDIPVSSNILINYERPIRGYFISFRLPSDLISGDHYLRFEQFNANDELLARSDFKDVRFYVDNRQLHTLVGRAARVNRKLSYGIVYVWDGTKTIGLGILTTSGELIRGTYVFTKDIAKGTWNVTKEVGKGAWQLTKDVASALYTVTGARAFMKWVDGKDRPLEEQMQHRTARYLKQMGNK